MPKACEHQSHTFSKVLLMGDPGAGKTGSLASLVNAGYEVFVLDFDNGLDILINVVKSKCPTGLDRIYYESFSDPGKTKDGRFVKPPTTFPNTLNVLTHWKFPERKILSGKTIPAEDYGPPAEWGPKRVLVLDSMTALGRAIMAWVTHNMPSKDPRNDFYNAQMKLEELIQLITADAFRTNLIVMSHVNLIGEEGAEIGYPTTIGKALSMKIGGYFNTILQIKGTGLANAGSRFILTQPDGQVSLKNANPFGLQKKYPIETGLADIFSVLQGTSKP